jgi:hypothetical protein
MVKIPTLTFEEVSTDRFRNECLARFLPAKVPKFKVGDVVEVVTDFGRKLPGTVIGVQAGGSDKPWFYDIARPRLADGVLERVRVSDDRLTLIESV